MNIDNTKNLNYGIWNILEKVHLGRNKTI